MNVLMRIRKQRSQGFTIVELLIVVVVIAILAAITIVAYNGVTSRANDSARLSDVDVLNKGVQMRGVESGTVGYGDSEPTTRDEVLQLYKVPAMSSRVLVCDVYNEGLTYDDNCPTGSGAEWDKSKIYMMVQNDYMEYGYWSNAKNNWQSIEWSSWDGTVRDDDKSDFYNGCGPINLRNCSW